MKGARYKPGSFKRYYWSTRPELRTTARFELKAPINTQIHAATLIAHLAPANKIGISCPFDSPCAIDGDGVARQSGDQNWKPIRLLLHAPAVLGDDVSQTQALEQLIRTANDKEAKVIGTYKANADDSDIKAIRVILTIDSMTKR